MGQKCLFFTNTSFSNIIKEKYPKSIGLDHEFWIKNGCDGGSRSHSWFPGRLTADCLTNSAHITILNHLYLYYTQKQDSIVGGFEPPHQFFRLIFYPCCLQLRVFQKFKNDNIKGLRFLPLTIFICSSSCFLSIINGR